MTSNLLLLMIEIKVLKVSLSDLDIDLSDSFKISAMVPLDSPYLISYLCLLVEYGLTWFLLGDIIFKKNLRDDFNLSRSLKVKCDIVPLHSPYM